MSDKGSVLAGKRILVTGGAGFLGRHVVNQLVLAGVDSKLISVPRSCMRDLRNPDCATDVVGENEIVIHLAGDVGGIQYNQRSGSVLLRNNLLMGMNVLDAAARSSRVHTTILVGTVCSYPKFCPVPFEETALWSGFPEETNAPYGIAKRTLIEYGNALYWEGRLSRFVSVIPTNLYGPGDNFDTSRAHVIPALIRKFWEADGGPVEIWGDGKATREFLYVEDAAKGIVEAVRYSFWQGKHAPGPFNLGSGEEVSILALANMVRDAIGRGGEIRFDPAKPNGQPRRLVSSEAVREAFGWQAFVDLRAGLEKTVAWWRKAVPDRR